MMLDRKMLRDLGWSEELVSAAEKVASSISQPFDAPVIDRFTDFEDRPIVTKSIRLIDDRAPTATSITIK